MRRHALLLPLATLGLWTAFAQAPIPITNPGFEDDLLTCAPGANCFSYNALGWLQPWLPLQTGGTFKPSVYQYPDGAPQGEKVAFLDFGGVIFQTVSTILQANRTYTLRLYVGRRADVAFQGYLASILAGGITLASDDTLNPAPGTFLEDVIVYRSGANPALVGQLLQISIRAGDLVKNGGQVDIDNISLTVE